MTVTTADDLRAAAQLRYQAAEAARHDRGDIAYRQLRLAPPVGTGRRGRPVERELRAVTEVRGAKELVHTSGYFTRYDTYYPMWDASGSYREKVCRGAGAQTLASNPEVAFLTNHAGMAMARTTSGTLELREDPQGGWHDGWLNPKRSDVSDLVIAINDGDVPQMSFAFVIPEGGGEWSADFMSFDIRRYDIDGGDVSACNFGANPYTDISARMADVLADIDRLPEGAAREAADRLVQRGAVARERIEVRSAPARSGPRPAPGTYPARLAGRLARTVDRFEAHFGRDGVDLDEVRNGNLPWYEIRNADGDTDSAAVEDEGLATVFVYDEIGGSMGVTAKQFAMDLAAITAPRIAVRINSPGGSVFDGSAIYSSMLHHPSSIRTFVDGLAASAASYLAMGASAPDDPEDPNGWGGIRFMPGGQMMIHDASATVEGNAGDMGRWVDFLDRQSDNVADYYVRVAGGTREEWRAKMLAETWYFADEALADGLADAIEPHPRAAAEDRMQRAFDLSRFGYRFTSRSAAQAPRTATRTARWAGRPQFARGGVVPVRLADGAMEVDPEARERFGEVLDRLNDTPTRPVADLPATPERATGRSIASVENWLKQQELR